MSEEIKREETTEAVETHLEDEALEEASGGTIHRLAPWLRKVEDSAKQGRLA